jgi:hypothetical protein
MTKQDLQNEIEKLIDASTVQEIVEAISIVCGEKSSHIESAWQDTRLAKAWRHDAVVLDNIEHKLWC